LDAEDYNKATVQLIRQYMVNENMTRDNLADLIQSEGDGINLDNILDEQKENSQEDLQAIAKYLNIELSDLMLSKSVKGHEVVVRKHSETKGYFFPNNDNKRYQIYPLARSSKMAAMKGFNIDVLSADADMENPFVSSLNSYVYNYGTGVALFKWVKDGQSYEERIEPGSSLYIQPFIRHSFSKTDDQPVQLCVVRISSAINLSTQKELSYFADIDRIIESKCWFD